MSRIYVTLAVALWAIVFSFTGVNVCETYGLGYAVPATPLFREPTAPHLRNNLALLLGTTSVEVVI